MIVDMAKFKSIIFVFCFQFVPLIFLFFLSSFGLLNVFLNSISIPLLCH